MFEQLKHFVQTLIHSLNPTWYPNIASLKPKETVRHMVLVLVFSMVVMCIFMLPSIFSLSSSMKNDLGAFQTFRIRGEVNMTHPIVIPANDAELIIDLESEKRIIKNEKLLVTHDYIYFKPLGSPLRINVKKLMDPLQYKDEAASFLAMFFIFIIPALLIFLFLMFAIKYAIIIGVGFGLAFFILRGLLLYKISWKRVFNTVAYSATLMIFLEIAFIPLNGAYLVPLFQMMFLNFYLIPIIIFIGYIITSLWVVEHKTSSEQKSSEWQF